MSGQRVGYVRVSTLDQSTVRQLDGVTLDRVFEDKASGKDVHRPQLEEMIEARVAQLAADTEAAEHRDRTQDMLG
ncbi:recombinase family protein [Rathayibacter sp. VKM Ac-2928]|uniref:recombinase family protein n=1 Tax=Rathayibacter sp. VKM Ac-2928 TaxID=2929479 RepID=UPI002437312A|nr:recombinase family protein [Rathayibacter sp. VKM Ac-2928]